MSGSIVIKAGWNDPPVLGLPDNTSSSTSRRPRARVYHSVDGVGAAGTNPSAMHPNPIVAAGPVPPVLPPTTPYGVGMQQQLPPVSQTTLPVPMVSQQPMQPAMLNPPLTYDTASTISRLAAQVNKVLGDASLEIPGKESIIATISSLQVDLSLNRISSGASELVKQFISFLELRDFKKAESTLSVIKQHSEVANWAVALHHLMYYSHLQALRQ